MNKFNKLTVVIVMHSYINYHASILVLQDFICLGNSTSAICVGGVDNLFLWTLLMTTLYLKKAFYVGSSRKVAGEIVVAQ